jgi:hypothetical protein
MFWVVDNCKKKCTLYRPFTNFYTTSGNRYRQKEANKLSQSKYFFFLIVSQKRRPWSYFLSFYRHSSTLSLWEDFKKMPIDVSACISISIACIAHATTGRHAPVAYCTCAHATYVIEMQPAVGGGGGRGCVLQYDYELINYIDTKAKCRYLIQLTWTGISRQMFRCLRPPPLLGFCLRWSCNFVFWIWSDKECLNSYRIWSPTGHNAPHPTPSQPQGVCINCTLT